VKPIPVPCAYVEFICAEMEFANLMSTVTWAFQPSAFYTRAARRQLVRDANRFLRRIRYKRMQAGFHPDHRECLHRACCDVTDLLEEVQAWAMRWPMVLAAMLVAAEGAFLHPGILEFSYSPELPKQCLLPVQVRQHPGGQHGPARRLQWGG
jgi:hypothetical protein